MQGRWRGQAERAAAERAEETREVAVMVVIAICF
jgi:hypothetical protein